MNENITIYMLHCEAQGGGAEHYIGSTATKNFKRRMQDHLSRNGAQRTKELYDRTERWWLAIIFKMNTRMLEYALQKLDDPAIICPICNPKLRAEMQQDIKILRHRKPNFDENYPLTWSSACGPPIK